MKSLVKKWGNSAAVRIPAAVLNAVGLNFDAPIDIRAEAHRIVITPLAPAAFDLDSLIGAISDHNRHDEIATGPARGNETW